MNLLNRAKVFFAGLTCFAAVSGLVLGEDRFALAVDPQDKLVISGPNGDRVSEISVPTIAETAKVGDVSFQVSYGKDSSGQLTAILTSSATSPAPLHFDVLGKAIDAANAVVTLTFSMNLRSVSVDPGYVGSVEVNSHLLRRHNLAEELAPAPAITPSPVVAPAAVATSQPADSTMAAPAATTSAPKPSANISQPLAPAMLASQLPALGKEGAPAAPATAQSDAAKSPELQTVAGSDAVATAAAAGPQQVKLYWSEPVTGPDGTAPTCGLDEIKLVEVHGSISITFPNGEVETGVEGMTVPSGSSVVTGENSSAALFMGGVNSARLMPKCELSVAQSFDGSTRKETLNLVHGAVFSRVGARDGEVQDYQVHTPEGSTGAECANMLAFRGSAEDVPGVQTTLNLGPAFDPHQLLAWNPVTMSQGLVSDVVNPLISAPSGPHSGTSTIFYYAPTASLNLNQVKSVVIAATATNGQNSTNTNNPNTILQGILLQVVPYNIKLNPLLTAINSGTASPAAVAYYHQLITIFFSNQIPSLAQQFSGAQGTKATFLALLRDLRPFNTALLTPF